MNTTKKGDEFEDRSYDLINRTVSSGELGLISSHCKVFRKKGYYSERRKSEIKFDLTIEVWPPSAERYTLLYIIECKNYSHNVPVDDIEEFHNKIEQVSGVNVKGVFVTNIGFQKGAYNIADSIGMMLIQLNYDESHRIILHKIRRSESDERPHENWDLTIEKILFEVFNKNTKILGLKRLSSEKINSISKDFLNEFNPDIINYYQSLPINDLIEYLRWKHQLTVEFSDTLGLDSRGNKVEAIYDREENRIHIDASLENTERFKFIFSHELGHFLLHQDLKMNQIAYNSFSDSQYNFRLGKHKLDNEKQWIEWQANHFAACLILPATSLRARLILFQDKKGIRNQGTIYYDHQPINRIDFGKTITFLSNFFKVTATNVKYRLEELGILTYGMDTFKQVGNINIFD